MLSLSPLLESRGDTGLRQSDAVVAELDSIRPLIVSRDEGDRLAVEVGILEGQKVLVQRVMARGERLYQIT